MESVSEDNFDIILSMLEEEELLDQVFSDEIAETVQEVSFTFATDNFFSSFQKISKCCVRLSI